MIEKELIRKQVKSRAKSISREKRQEASVQACDILFNHLFNILNNKIQGNNKILIGIYHAYSYEIDISKLENIFQNLKPDVLKSDIQFLYANKKSKDVVFDINENLTASIYPDILIIPCIGSSFNKYRIGHGFGGYDKFIHNAKKQKNIITIGVVYDNNIFDTNSWVESHDMQMDYIITNKRLIC